MDDEHEVDYSDENLEEIADESNNSDGNSSDDAESEQNSDNEDSDEDGSDSGEDEHEDTFWDKAVNTVYDDMHETLQTTFKQLSEKYPTLSVKELENKAFKNIKQKYSSKLRQYYLNFLELTNSLRKDPIQKKIMETAKRLREDEDYGSLESIRYAVKKIFDRRDN